jgi:hypothetical protein
MAVQGQHRRVSGRLGSQLLAVGLVVFSASFARAQARDVEGAKRWQLGEPAPVGYHVARKHTVGLVGGSLLAAGYGVSALYGTVFLTECDVPGADGRPSDPCNPNPENRAAPFLFIPIAGPFLTFTNRDVRHDGGAVFWFSTFGAIQVVGAALLVYDLAVPHYGLKRGDGETMTRTAQPRVSVAPTYLENKPGLVVVGQF